MKAFAEHPHLHGRPAIPIPDDAMALAPKTATYP